MMVVVTFFTGIFEWFLLQAGNPFVAVALFAISATVVLHAIVWGAGVSRVLEAHTVPQHEALTGLMKEKYGEDFPATAEDTKRLKVAKAKLDGHFGSPLTSCLGMLIVPVLFVIPFFGWLIYAGIAALPHVDLTLWGLDFAMIPLRNPLMADLGLPFYLLTLWILTAVINTWAMKKFKEKVKIAKIINKLTTAVIWLSLPLIYPFSRIFVGAIEWATPKLTELRAKAKYDKNVESVDYEAVIQFAETHANIAKG